MPTRTLTEFSGTIIRLAAKAEAEARKSLPKEATQVESAPPPEEPEVTAQPAPAAGGAGEAPHREPEVPGGPAEASESGAFDSASEVAGESAAAAEASLEAQTAQAAEADEAAAAKTAEPQVAQETEAVKAALDEAVAKATGTSGDRLARLREALQAARGKEDRVRLVRVLAGEEQVAGAARLGEHQYMVDLMPASMKQTFKDPKEERGGRRGPRRPGSGGGQGGKPGQPQTLEGSFSMESVLQDRRNERGPGRRPGGGGRPGGGRSGGGGKPGGPGGGRSPKP